MPEDFKEVTPEPQISNKPFLYSVGFLFLFAMHYYQPNAGGVGLSLAINNTVWIAISLVIATGLYRIAQTGKIIYGRLESLAVLLLICLALPFLWSVSPWRETVFDRYLSLIALLLLLVCFRQFNLKQQEQNYLWALVCAGVLIQALIGLIQLFMQDEWVIISGGRPPGSFQQINVYASFLATGLAISLYQLLIGAVDKKIQVFYLAIIFIVVALQTLVLSRTGVIATIVVLSGFCWLLRDRLRQVVILVLLVIAGILSALALQHTTATEGRQLEGTTNPGYRGTLYSLSWELIKEKPVSGHGLGRFQAIFIEKQADAYERGEVNYTHNSEASSHPHNELLFWWVEAGLLPVLALVAFALFVTTQLWMKPGKKYKGLWFCLFPIGLHSQTEFPFYLSSVHLFLFFLLLSNSDMWPTKSVTFRLTFLARSMAIIFVVVTPVFMISNLHTMYLFGRFAAESNAKYLEQVINPLGQKAHYDRFLGIALIQNGSKPALSLAEQLQEEEVVLWPSDYIYTRYHLNLQALGKSAKAEEVFKRGSYLFPESRYFKKIVD